MSESVSECEQNTMESQSSRESVGATALSQDTTPGDESIMPVDGLKDWSEVKLKVDREVLESCSTVSNCDSVSDISRQDFELSDVDDANLSRSSLPLDQSDADKSTIKCEGQQNDTVKSEILTSYAENLSSSITTSVIDDCLKSEDSKEPTQDYTIEISGSAAEVYDNSIENDEESCIVYEQDEDDTVEEVVVASMQFNLMSQQAKEKSPNFEDRALSSRIPKDLELPDTVTRLSGPDGSEVFLVGTAHFSKESQDDVATTIEKVCPDVVMVELCKSRIAILRLDEETILNESKSLDFGKMKVIIQRHGAIQGALHLLLLSVSAHITKHLGMAPGGEFRTAFSVARRVVPNCLIFLGDRPIHITLSRALSSLNVWQKAKLVWHIISSKEPITKEEIEKCKQKDIIEEMLAEMTGHFPAVSEAFVKERDIYLTKSLQSAAYPAPGDALHTTCDSPRVVVGVVGIGHVAGIVEHWGKVSDEDIEPIMIVPPPNFSDRVVKLALQVSLCSLIGFSVYKCLPSAAKSSLHSFLDSSFQSLKTYQRNLF